MSQVIADTYQVEGVLAEGSTSVLYRAFNRALPHLKTRLVVKVLREELAQEEINHNRFSRDARASSLADCGADTFDFGLVDDGRPYVVMLLLQGPTLAELLAGKRPLDLPRAISLLGQAARALELLHGVGLVHRNLKPGHLIAVKGEEGGETVKLLDFFWSALVGVDSAREPGPIAQCPLAPQYRSPELWSGNSFDHRADIYSLGAIAFEMLVGRPPFSGNGADLQRAHMEAAPPIPSTASRRSDVPPALDELIVRCLSKDPCERPQSAEALVQQLAHIA